MALANRAVCLHKLARLSEAVVAQERAIRLHLAQYAPSLYWMLRLSTWLGSPALI